MLIDRVIMKEGFTILTLQPQKCSKMLSAFHMIFVEIFKGDAGKLDVE